MSEVRVGTGTSTRGEVRRRFLAVDTANVADVLDGLGLRGQVLDPSFRAFSGDRLAGWAFTVAGSIRDLPTGKDELKFEACSQVGADEVTVWAGGGGDTCFLGELIAVGLSERGCTGALVHGGTRDLRWLRQHGFAIFGTARSPLQSAGRWSVDGYRVPVTLPGAGGSVVVVNPGDFVLGDDDGVLVVPGVHVEEVLSRAESLTRHEEGIRADLAGGMTLTECLARHGKV